MQGDGVCKRFLQKTDTKLWRIHASIKNVDLDQIKTCI